MTTRSDYKKLVNDEMVKRMQDIYTTRKQFISMSIV